MTRLLNISRFLPDRVESACQPRLPADRLHLPIRVIVEWKREQARMIGERMERRG